MSAQTPNPAVEALRRAIFSARPDGQLPEIILEVDSTTRFSWLLLGREPGSCAELLMVYAAVLAHGTSLTAADIARMVPELASAAIQQMMNRIADERKLRQAADAVHGIHAPASDRGTLGACRPGIVGHDRFWTPPKSA